MTINIAEAPVDYYCTFIGGKLVIVDLVDVKS